MMSLNPKVIGLVSLLYAGSASASDLRGAAPDSSGRDVTAGTSVAPVAEVYNIGGNCPADWLTGSYAGSVDRICEGAAMVEKFFGFEPGEHVKSLFFAVLPFRGNAMAQYLHPDAFKFHPMILAMESGLEFQAFHEGVHLFDDRYGYRLSGGEFKTLHGEIKKNNAWFFEKLNEDNCLPGVTHLGHAQDDEHEFLASFINSFNHPDWEAFMQGAGEDFEAIYLKTLLALKGNLCAIDEIPDSSPLVRKTDFLLERFQTGF